MLRHIPRFDDETMVFSELRHTLADSQYDLQPRRWWGYKPRPVRKPARDLDGETRAMHEAMNVILTGSGKLPVSYQCVEATARDCEGDHYFRKFPLRCASMVADLDYQTDMPSTPEEKSMVIEGIQRDLEQYLVSLMDGMREKNRNSVTRDMEQAVNKYCAMYGTRLLSLIDVGEAAPVGQKADDDWAHQFTVRLAKRVFPKTR